MRIYNGMHAVKVNGNKYNLFKIINKFTEH